MKNTPSRSAGEISFSILLLLLSLLLCWAAKQIDTPENLSLSSAGSLPLAAAGLMAICSATNLIRSIYARADFTGSALDQFKKQVLPKSTLIITSFILIFIFCLEYLGFNLSSYLFLVTSSYFLGVRKKTIIFLVPAIFLIAIHFIFQTVFSVILPSGSWWVGA